MIFVVLLVVVAAFLLWMQSGFSNPYGQPNVTTENAQAQPSGCGGSVSYTLTFTFTLMNSGDRAANVGLGMRLNGTPVSLMDYYAPARSSVAKISVVSLSGPCPMGPLVAEVRVLSVTPA